jgi:hypothetical protein
VPGLVFCSSLFRVVVIGAFGAVYTGTCVPVQHLGKYEHTQLKEFEANNRTRKEQQVTMRLITPTYHAFTAVIIVLFLQFETDAARVSLLSSAHRGEYNIWHTQSKTNRIMTRAAVTIIGSHNSLCSSA